MKKQRAIITTIIAAALSVSLAGCSGAAGSSKAEAMDFQAKLELKAPDPAVGSSPKILFVGNSHVFYNNLSMMFLNIVNSQGYKSSVKELSSGYYSLKQYAETDDQGGALLDKTLSRENWDFVILQENTSMALANAAEKEMFPPSRILDEKIKAAGGQSVFLMTWAPKNGMKIGLSQQKREAVQANLAGSYMTIADELDALLAPAGIGFMRCAQEYPDIELWDTDKQHPSLAGSYLAACILYSVIYQESPENCPYISELDQDVASKLQSIAADLVLG